ncbi:UDP-glycosyltransferase 71K1 [Cajanus cajan]|uniref:Glycosyltransferase n=1 Tax=Cajanus cajan TaxID=3821 RepID=A0A151U0Q6_CAJCA|nr:UDP-glycosyltransferase 71K1 [Cajanus cajan]KYP72899.1 Anthocyanidin 3-O-glucosyltransferase 1 [Cajanus cajan]
MGGTEMKKNADLIFIPSPGIGHLTSSLEFAQLLINRDSHLSITILCIKFHFTPFAESYIRSVLASQPKIKLIDLPEVEPPSQELALKSIEHYICTFMESLKPHVMATMQNILSSYPHPVVGLVLDFFCLSMVDVGNELGIPSYMFMTSNVAFTAFMLSLLKRQIEDVFSDSDPELLIPGFPDPVPPSVLPGPAFNKDGGYVAFYKLAQRFMDTKGIIVNSFYEMEKYAIGALSDGQTPPIYAVGPLIDLKGRPNPNLDQAQHDKVLKWLDEQPPSSVVFLCFGSMGSFDPSQTREIAIALKRSGVRFLWAMGSPPTRDNADRTLTEGFLEWMEGRGMICGWAPQVEVLAHKAIGGFVSHCGWNSILESLWFGVPILTWPIYAEQQLNAFRMVREFGLAVELRLDYRKGSDLVMAEDIEKGLKQLMDKDNMVHKKVKEMQEKARKAVLTGGSSFISVGELIDNVIGRN